MGGNGPKLAKVAYACQKATKLCTQKNVREFTGVQPLINCPL